MAFLCVSQQGEFKSTIKNFFGKIHVKTFWPKKVEKKNFFPVVFSHRFFFNAFLAVSLHEEPKNTIKIFSKIKPEKLFSSPGPQKPKTTWFLFLKKKSVVFSDFSCRKKSLITKSGRKRL
jgi:hypothetical protein